jgi:uncharacterized protein YceK
MIILKRLNMMIYLLTTIGLTTSGSSTVQINTKKTEKHNEIEYPERNIHINKKLKLTKEYMT